MLHHLQNIDVTDTIFFEPGKTDKLLSDLEKQRTALEQLHADSVGKGIELSEVVSNLQLMEEKTFFFAEMVDKTQGVFVPPPKGVAEVGMLAIQKHVFGNLSRFSNVAGLLAAPLVVDIVFRAGTYAGKISKVGRVSRVMKHARYAKVMKFAKGAMVLAVAAEVASLVINMVASRQMNDQLRAELKDLRAKTAKGRKDYQTLVAGLADAKAQRDELLAQAGVSTPEEYVQTINEALAQMGRQKANFDTARRMLQHKMPDDVILSMLNGLSEEALALIKTRLQAESLLAAGQSQVDVAAQIGLDPEQVAEIALVVDARNALVRGLSVEEVADSMNIGPGLLEDVDDMLDEALPDNWAKIEGDGSLDSLAADMLLSEAALAALRTELKAKSLLHTGTGVGPVSESLGVDRDEVVGWASELPVAAEAARNQRTQGMTEPSELAAANRLPLAMVAG
jgi:hypothetical protein